MGRRGLEASDLDGFGSMTGPLGLVSAFAMQSVGSLPAATAQIESSGEDPMVPPIDSALWQRREPKEQQKHVRNAQTWEKAMGGWTQSGSIAW